METIASIELQKAVFKVLSANYPIFDVVPDNSIMPYISFGDISKFPNKTKTELDRYQFTLLLHTWSRGQSSIQSKTINQFVLNQMDNLIVDGYSVEWVELTMDNTIKQQEAKDTIFHGVLEFEITLSKIKGE